MTQKQLEQGLQIDQRINIYDQAFRRIAEDCIGTFHAEVKSFLTETLQEKINELKQRFEQL